ncbi:alginate O-acetyltransferase AlgX-related protein [Salinicola acroporae]|uniref:alginate O-acetyltransferase AlgX-related protein n=1 Tax=Salinicola acroporae TaxID=1541440 RepID=UPI000DA22556|nr:hypothetical protein [Salinicola acroporae]
MSSTSFAERIEQVPELVVQAEARLGDHDFSGAIALLEPAFRAGIDSLDLSSALMQAYEGAGDTARQEALMAVVLQKSPQPPLKLSIAYAEAAMRRSDWSSAVQRWQSILDHQPSFPPQVYLRQARALLAAKQFTAALGVVDLALEARPDDPVLVDLKSVIASHKAKKYQVVVQPLQTAPRLHWEVVDGQRQIAALETFRRYRVRGWVDAPADQQPELIAIYPEGESSLTLEREPQTGMDAGTWRFEHSLDVAAGVTLGVRSGSDELQPCARLSVTPVMEVVEGREGWLFLANDTNASVDQFTGRKRLSDEERSQWRFFAAGLGPLQRQRSLLFLIANSKEMVRPEYYPYARADVTITEQVSTLLEEGGIEYCNPVTAMQAEADSYYPTDTHWSGRGAYIAFAACMRHFGFDDDFESQYVFEKRDVVGDLGSKSEPPAKSSSTVAVFREKSGVFCRFSNYLPGTGNITIFENTHPVHARTLVIFGGSSAGAGGFATLFANVFRRVVVVNLPGSYVHEIVDREAADHVILQTNERYLATPGRIVKTLAEAELERVTRAMPAGGRVKLMERMSRFESCEPYHDFMKRLLAG